MKKNVLLLLLFPCMTWAAPLAIWDFDGGSPGRSGINLDSTGTVETVEDAEPIGATLNRITPSSITNVGPGGGSGGIEPYAEGGAISRVGEGSGFGETPSDTSYISFLLRLGETVDSSVSHLEGIQFDLARGGNGDRGFEVTYRVGDIGTFTSLGTTLPPAGTNNYGNFTFNLDTPAPLGANDDVEFRLLGFAGFTTNTLHFDNVTVTAIPEPGSLILVALGMTGVVLLKRRFR